MYQRFPLEALNCDPLPNIGGSKEYIWVMRAEHVAAIPTSCDGEETSEPIQIKSGTASVRYTFPHETLGFQENQRYGPGGEYFEIILEGFRDRISPTHQHEICKLAPGYYIIIYQDANRYIRLLGTPDKPLRFTSGADTKKQRSELNGALWRFYGVTKCPAIFMDKNIEPPNELLIPLANLTINRNTVLGNCFWQVSASGSQLSDGTSITAATPYGTAILKYQFYYGTVLLYGATIGPDEDATDIANWNYVGGTRSSALFESQIVDHIVTGGKGFEFTVDLSPLSILDSPATLSIELIVDDWAQESLPSRKTFSLCLLRYAFSLTTTLETGFDFSMKHTGPGNIYIDWGDQTVETFSDQTLFSMHNYSHDYTGPGTYQVDVYLAATSVDYLDFVSEAVISANIDSCVNLSVVYGRSNAISNTLNWQNFLLLDDVNVRANSDLQYLYLPSVSPIAPLRQFVAYACDIQNPLDFTPYASTIERVEVYGNENLTFVDVSNCVVLTDYVARNCDITNDQDLTGCVLLDRISIYSNSYLTFVDVTGLTNLDLYHAQSCNISNEQNLISAGNALSEVRLQDNNIPNVLLGNHVNLEVLYLHNNALSGTYDLNGCTSLVSLDLSGNAILNAIFDLCTQLVTIRLEDNAIDSQELNRIVDDVFDFRSAVVASKTLNISGNIGVLTSGSLDKINGTGSHIGDGLVDNNWTVII